MKKTLVSKKAVTKFAKISKKELHQVKGGRQMNTGTSNGTGGAGADNGAGGMY